MKAIMISCSPKEVCGILNGDISILVRKTFPKDYVGWVYVYCTKASQNKLDYYIQDEKWFVWKKIYHNYLTTSGENTYFRGKVVAKFWCNVEKIEVETFETNDTYRYGHNYYTKTLDESELLSMSCLYSVGPYLDGCYGCAIYITKLEIFDKPKELSEFKHIKPSVCGVKDNNGLYQCDKCKYGHSEFWHCECRLPLTKAPKTYRYVEVEE